MNKKVKEEIKKTEKGMEGAEKMQDKVKLNIAKLSKIQKDLEEKSEIITKYPYINEDGEIVYEVWKMKNAKEPYYTMRPLGNGWIVNPFLDNFYKDTFLYSIGVK